MDTSRDTARGDSSGFAGEADLRPGRAAAIAAFLSWIACALERGSGRD